MDSRIVEYQSGKVVFHEGDPSNVAYIVLQGSLEVSVGRGEQKKVLASIHPVTVFGEMALLSHEKKRSATVQATTYCKLVEITQKNFDEYIKESPKVISTILTVLVERLKKTNERIVRSPELLVSIASALDLMRKQQEKTTESKPQLKPSKPDEPVKETKPSIRYDDVVIHFAQMFGKEEDEIERSLAVLEGMSFIEVTYKGHDKLILILAQDDMVKKVKTIQAGLMSL